MTALDDFQAAAINQTETHPGAVVDVSAEQDGWRMGVANAWTAIRHAQTADECRSAIAALGNKGPGK